MMEKRMEEGIEMDGYIICIIALEEYECTMVYYGAGIDGDGNDDVGI
jgi:hypothetical protein